MKLIEFHANTENYENLIIQRQNNENHKTIEFHA